MAPVHGTTLSGTALRRTVCEELSSRVPSDSGPRRSHRVITELSTADRLVTVVW